MRRLMNEFGKVFKLDHEIHGTPLGDLIEAAIEDAESRAAPDWGVAGSADRRAADLGDFVDFHYSPHLFPEMELALRLAHKLQFHLLPREVPPTSPLSIAAVLESYCHLSGDLFGWESLDDGRFLVWIVDLSGHGVQAGLASAVLKVIIRGMRRRSRVDKLAGELNDLFVGSLCDDRGSLFATGFFVAIDDDGDARYTSAGHPPMLVRRVGGGVQELPALAIPIGMFPGQRYEARDLRLEPGDTLLLYTDGVVEATDAAGIFFGLDRLRGFMEAEFDSPRAVTHALYREIAGFQDMDRLDDDVTFLAARRK